MKSPISVLVLEKSQTFSMYLALLLQRMGLKSLRVNATEGARTVLKRGFTDVVIVGDHDDTRPTHVIIQELTSFTSGRPVPIIVITSNFDPDEWKACHEAGCQEYLLKPIQPKKLHDALYAGVMPGNERRRNLRCVVNLTAEVSVDHQPPQTHEVVNLSRGGALLSSARIYPTGAKVSMQLDLEGLQIPLAGTVHFMLASDKDGTECSFCVLFQQINQEHAELIDQYVAKVLDQCHQLSIAHQQARPAHRQAGEDALP